MKLAIVFDDLIQHGGAERVLEEISDIFPDAPIYTSLASKEWLEKFSKKGRVAKTSFLQKFPFAVKLNRFYSVFLLHILAFESFDLSEFDVVLSYSSRYSHFVITKPYTKHICYMNTPGRMFWEPAEYFRDETFGILKPFKSISKFFLKYPLSYLRIADFYSSKKVDVFYANSSTSKDRIKKYYGRDSEVIYPFIDLSKFAGVEAVAGDYYLVITRLVSWKKVDIAVEACTNLHQNLKVIGDGPDIERVKSLAGDSVEFFVYVEEKEKIDILRKCKAVIITQKEDFGIVALEAMACGKSVIAFGKGGVTETVVPGVTGEFFGEQTSTSLEKVLKSFDKSKYYVDKCREQVSLFNKDVFQERIRRAINV